MIVLGHIHQIETATEHHNGQGTVVLLAIVVEGDIVARLDDLACGTEELLVRQTLLDEVLKNAQGAVQLVVGSGGHNTQHTGEKGRPSVGEVGLGNLANDQTSGNLDLSVALASQAEGKEHLSELVLVVIRDREARGLAVIWAPVVLDELAQVGQGRLANADGERGVDTDAGDRNGEIGVRFGVGEVELGLFARALLGKLRVGQQLRQLLLHLVHCELVMG